MQKASHATNFAMAAEGSVAIGVVQVGASNSFGANQGADSAETKRSVRESTVKAAQEYRDERTLEIATEESVSGETVEKRTITNPNNELTVTYLLYELQRRFEVAEQLHMVRPVVLVAFDVPSPDEITEAWLIAHAWIIRRVILDDRMLPALDYLIDAFAGDELGVEIIARPVGRADARRRFPAREHGDVGRGARRGAAGAGHRRPRAWPDATVCSRTSARRCSLARPTRTRSSLPSGNRPSRRLEWADADLLAQRARLEGSVNALQQATDAYVEGLRRSHQPARRHRSAARPREGEHPPLHAGDLVARADRPALLPAVRPAHPVPGDRAAAGSRAILADVTMAGRRRRGQLPATPAAGRADHGRRTRPRRSRPAVPNLSGHRLRPRRRRSAPSAASHEVADVDTLLGFKGNYAMFPLREGNAITDYMAQSFLDSYFGVLDPDPFGADSHHDAGRGAGRVRLEPRGHHRRRSGRDHRVAARRDGRPGAHLGGDHRAHRSAVHGSAPWRPSAARGLQAPASCPRPRARHRRHAGPPSRAAAPRRTAHRAGTCPTPTSTSASTSTVGRRRSSIDLPPPAIATPVVESTSS